MPISTLEGYPRIGGVIGYGPVGGSGVWKLQERYALADDFYDDVSLLLKMNGANGSTAFLDSSQFGHAVTANGNSQISTTESKFGGSSAYFDGTGDYLTVPISSSFIFGTEDLTVEMWVYVASHSPGATDVIASVFQDSSNGWTLGIGDATGRFYFSLEGNTGRLDNPNALLTNQWVHLAATRQGSSFRFFENGSLVASGTNSANVASTSNLHIGTNVGGGALNFNGYIDSLRITKGQALYTAAFTPPQRDFLP